MIAGFPVGEINEGEETSLLEGLCSDDLAVGEILFTEFGDVYRDGYTEGSVEEVATGTLFLFECERARYLGVPPDRYRDDYYQVERALEALWEDPQAAEYLRETERILASVELFLQHRDPDVQRAEQCEYIYGLYSEVVDPYLIKVGRGEMDIQDVIHEMELARNPRRASMSSHKRASKKKVKILML